MGKLGSIILIVLAVAAFVFIASSTGGNVWTKGTIRFRIFKFKATSGLWKTCVEGSKCVEKKNVPDWQKAVRAFAIISCLTSVAAIALAILGLFTDKVKGLFVSIFLIVSAISMVLALVIFVAKIKSSPDGGLGWSYILGWVGVVLSGIGFVFGLLRERF